jgi:hypothetical protein
MTFYSKLVIRFVVFVCFESHEQFFSYLATATITVDRAANLDLRLALTDFLAELLQHGTSVFKVISERPVILTSECRALAKEQSLPILNVFKFDAAGTSGARTHDLPDAKREHYH